MVLGQNKLQMMQKFTWYGALCFGVTTTISIIICLSVFITGWKVLMQSILYNAFRFHGLILPPHFLSSLIAFFFPFHQTSAAGYLLYTLHAIAIVIDFCMSWALRVFDTWVSVCMDVACDCTQIRFLKSLKWRLKFMCWYNFRISYNAVYYYCCLKLHVFITTALSLCCHHYNEYYILPFCHSF